MTATADVLTAPLGQLLAEHDAFIHPSPIADEGCLGIGVRRTDGSMVLSIPAAATDEMRDSIARILLAQALGIDIPLPDCIEITRSVPGGHE